MTFEESLIEYCSPTLAGIKVASLYRFFPEDRIQFAHQYKFWRTQLSRCGLNLLILKGCPKTASYLLYLFRDNDLRQTLSSPETCSYLSSLGYDVTDNHQGLVRQIIQRLCLQTEFPHEIGLFLGYPLEDVKGFIQNRGAAYTSCGCWKSYGDPQEARRCFSSYQACTSLYKRCYTDGIPITRLIVAA